MQSVTAWEAIRGLFATGFKTAANKAAIARLVAAFAGNATPNVTTAKERYEPSDLPPPAQDERQDRSDHHRDDEHVLGRIDDRWRKEE
jgi:hypothetical protein